MVDESSLFRVCWDCKIEKSVAVDFHKNSKRKLGFAYRCKACCCREYRRKTKQRVLSELEEQKRVPSQFF